MNPNPGSSSKVGKTTTTSGLVEEDRLGSFPDSILCHILSLMPTKFAARTSILSKRWKYLFLDVPKIIFNEDLLSKHDSFINFMNRRLILSKTHSSVAEFQLNLPKLPLPAVINLWVKGLLFRNLKVLEIKESGEPDNPTQKCAQYPPSEVLGWETLVELKLCGEKMVLKYHKLVNFPNLKVLHLKNLELESESKSLRFAKEGYPLLEDLRFHDVRFNCSKDDKAFLGLGIFLSTLKNLEIVADKPPRLGRVDIDTPCLRRITYNISEVHKGTIVQITFCKSEYLTTACFYDQFNSGGLHIELLRKINGVKELFISHLAGEELTYPLPNFANLRLLDLQRTGEKSMWNVLQNVPNLEVFILRLEEEVVDFIQPTDVPPCLAERLKEIRLRNFIASEKYIKADVGLVGFFLQNGAMLEKVNLEHPSKVTPNCRTLALEELVKLPRRSPKCVIELQKEG